jgi:hypothetical protein
MLMLMPPALMMMPIISDFLRHCRRHMRPARAAVAFAMLPAPCRRQPLIISLFFFFHVTLRHAAAAV